MSTPTVKRRLTPGRTRRVVEDDDYARFTRLVLAAHGRRIGSGDIEGLTDLSRLTAEINTAMTNAVTGLRTAGFSWADIAARLGVTRHAAHQRYGGGSTR